LALVISEILSSMLASSAFGMPIGLAQLNLPETTIEVEAPARKGWVLYTVRPGDTLSEIARRFRVDGRAIMYSSDLEGVSLRPGQLLRIPLVEEVNQEARLPPGVRTYIVRRGDTVQSVANRFGLTLLGLVSANPGLPSLDRLEVGSTLFIPTTETGLLQRLRADETIKDLASRFGLSVVEVARANGLSSPTDVSAGDLVLLPGIQARTTYSRLLQIREAERQAREAEERRLAQERRQREELRRRQAEQRRLQEARQRQQQALSQPRLHRASAAVAATGYSWPISRFVFTVPFGGRTPFQRFHTGIDLAAPIGTPIYAARAGQVSRAGWSRGGFGLHVIVDHGDSHETIYAHMSRIAVQPGQHVERGEVLGFVGSTGWSTGPHLHFEVRVNGVPRNPMAFLP
jgi:murein DD-endopeptidase MepM/ murein hydrolase activator NlpD